MTNSKLFPENLPDSHLNIVQIPYERVFSEVDAVVDDFSDITAELSEPGFFDYLHSKFPKLLWLRYSKSDSFDSLQSSDTMTFRTWWEEAGN